MSEEALSAHGIQEKAESTSDVEELRGLHAIVIRGDIGNAEERATLDIFIRGRMRKLSLK